MSTIPLLATFTAILTRSDVPGRDPSPPDPEGRRLGYVLSRAETAECTCPGFCERDHANE
jgi:hypothetical protein